VAFNRERRETLLAKVSQTLLEDRPIAGTLYGVDNNVLIRLNGLHVVGHQSGEEHGESLRGRSK
jgi:hypothetical protein